MDLSVTYQIAVLLQAFSKGSKQTKQGGCLVSNNIEMQPSIKLSRNNSDYVRNIKTH